MKERKKHGGYVDDDKLTQEKNNVKGKKRSEIEIKREMNRLRNRKRERERERERESERDTHTVL